MKHVIAYEGRVHTALALMQEQYVPLFVPWVNWRTGIDGTLQRPPYSHAMGVEWLQGLDKRKGQDEVFAVLARSDGKRKSYKYIGHMGVHRIDQTHQFAQTGSILGPDGQGAGHGTEAKLLIMYHAFMVLGVRKLVSTVKGLNGPSMGHLMKCGYHIVGRHERHHFHEGDYVDEVLFEVFRTDWEPIWAAYQETGELPKLTDQQRALIKEQTEK
jgi:RimJ/RimL family protein N-acetyltransferase